MGEKKSKHLHRIGTVDYWKKKQVLSARTWLRILESFIFPQAGSCVHQEE